MCLYDYIILLYTSWWKLHNYNNNSCSPSLHRKRFPKVSMHIVTSRVCRRLHSHTTQLIVRQSTLETHAKGLEGAVLHCTIWVPGRTIRTV